MQSSMPDDASKTSDWRLLDLEAWLKQRNPKLYEWLCAPSLTPFDGDTIGAVRALRELGESLNRMRVGGEP